jgi:hypothetical protein
MATDKIKIDFVIRTTFWKRPIVPDFLVVPAFMVGSGFPVVLAFRSFWLSGRSGFPVVLPFRSFWLSGLSGFLVVLAFRSFQIFLGRSSHCNQKKYKSIRRRPKIWLALPICKEIVN